jgi:hypothetical protein
VSVHLYIGTGATESRGGRVRSGSPFGQIRIVEKEML